MPEITDPDSVDTDATLWQNQLGTARRDEHTQLPATEHRHRGGLGPWRQFWGFAVGSWG